ncbi:MAG: beta galactosidase jelly roll domain-containing protein [Prevotella sp.]|nr:beta galactosidase jelly roll domain-containing protein [Prevotella sp.]
MKKLITIALLLTAVTTLQANETAAPQQGRMVPLVGNVLNRQTTSLNGEWRYIVDVQESGYYGYRREKIRNGFFRNAKPRQPEDLIEYDFDKSDKMTIPSDWNTRDERLFFYEGTVWFKRSFDFRPTEGHRTLLYFGAVNYEAIVFVNGQEVGQHVGGFTPFNFDVTDLLREGENTVIVKVDNKRRKDNVPTLIFDWWNYGGITRDVLLVDVASTYIENYALQLDRHNTKLLNCSVQLNTREAGRAVTIAIPELKIRQTVTTAADGSASLRLKVRKLQLWAPETPKLYRVELTLDGRTLTDEIGFRTIETRGKQLLLNGKPIFLKGISIHEEKPNGGGRANGAGDAQTLLSWAQELGCNFVRLAHYPHNEHMVRQAERMGILVWSEIPVYWTISWNSQETFDNASRQLNDVIRRDQNRANVIIWSIANETPHSPERDNFLSRLAQQAHSMDSTRLVSMAMEVLAAANYHNRLQDNMNKWVDVISFNQYIGWYRDVKDAPKMTWEIPYEKPVIVSEFGGGARYGLHGEKNQRWTEEFQENLYRENTAMLDKIDGLAGTTPWILKDFRSPRRVLNGIQDYYNRKGLFSDKGEKKKAFFVLKQWYEGK